MELLLQIQQLHLKKKKNTKTKEVKDTNNLKTQKNVKMFGYCGRCNRHTKSLLLAVTYGSWEGDTVGDTFYPNVDKNLEQDAGLQCTWDTEPPTAKVCPTGLDSKTSTFCWKTTGMRYPTAPCAFENFTLDSNATREGSHFKHSTKNVQYTVPELVFTATCHN